MGRCWRLMRCGCRSGLEELSCLPSRPNNPDGCLTPTQRIVVMGPPGSGKSTLARRLGVKYGLPVFHLDQLYWQPGWVERQADQFQLEVIRLAELPAWVIDGNYTASLARRFSTADTVVYVDAPTWVCMDRLLRRTLGSYGRVRIDAAPGCPERFDAAFLRFAWSWNRVRRARVLALVHRFPGRTVVLRTRAERRQLLSGQH